jgi:2,4-dienoyl-CoA reductase-like NADH-dependent reductase (Old Yellow Enzyme family)
MIKLYEDLAIGETGLIITGGLAVEEGATLTRCAPCIYDDKYIKKQKLLVDAVHEQSQSKICAQIAHTGTQTENKRYEPVGPSPVKPDHYHRVPKELTPDGIGRIVKNFIDSGRRVYEAGYDMVQLHAAHNYLLSSFLSPYFNRRTDNFGGSVKNRAKIIVDIYNGLRDELGKSYPIIIKIQVKDFIQGGLQFEEGKQFVQIMVDTGFDAVEISGGGAMVPYEDKGFPSVILKSKEDENYFLNEAKEIKPIIGDSPFILVGGLRDPVFADKILEDGFADYISLCRPLIREPFLPLRWKNGDLTSAKCISCNQCFQTIFPKESTGLECMVERRKKEKKGEIQNQ